VPIRKPRPGLDPYRVQASRDELLATGRYATVKAVPPASLPPAVSLGKHLLRWLNQGQAGTCWVHAPTAMAESIATARGYQPFPACRRLTAWQGKQYEGGGNPSDGGSGLDAIRAMSDKGAGIAHEDLCPYSDNRRTLAGKPAAKVFDDAMATHLLMPVVIDTADLDNAFARIKTLIGSEGLPVSIGIWWPEAWGEPDALKSSIGPGSYGHEVLVQGYAEVGVLDASGQAYWEIQNSWSPIYRPLDGAQQGYVPGYRVWDDGTDSPKSPSFWVRDDVLRAVCKKYQAGFEANTATDVWGLGSAVETDWSDDLTGG
jgi:hypothetical protein